MPDRLFPFLLLLTLIDLAFVQATGVVSGSGLLPLWLLAAAAPWLRRLQRLRTCRVTWNAVVLLVFAVLVHHASTTGLLYMLEDGLLLAVLCQVHLLNNVGERQRPDLVFFNSFLVAFVTSFFAPDLWWSILFVAHAFVFVPALQVNVAARRGDVPGELLWVLVRDAVPRTCTIGLVTAVAFVALPRDFARRGWLGDAMQAPEQLRGGIGEQVRLDNEFAVRLDDTVVMRLSAASGDLGDVPAHWRAIAFASFDGVAWAPQDASRLGSRFATDPPWEARGGAWVRNLRPGSTTVHVRVLDRSARHLPAPLHAREIRVASASQLLLDPRSWGVLNVLRFDSGGGPQLEYVVELGANTGAVRTTPTVRHRMVELPANGVPPVVADLAARLRAKAPPDASDSEIAAACCAWLQEHRRYELPGQPGFARNLGEFLIGTGAGHCEYFATALALLLRIQSIPCRLVGGYLVHERDPDGSAMVVRSRHAHAWVELLRADGSWETLDPTPAADVRSPREATSWWSAATASLESAWKEVVAFDVHRRTEWLQGLARLPATAVRAALARPGLLVVALAVVGLVLYRRGRRRQTAPAIVEFERAVRAAGLSLGDGETPRELLVRAAANRLRPERLAALEAAVRRHEHARYGPGSRGRR